MLKIKKRTKRFDYNQYGACEEEVKQLFLQTLIGSNNLLTNISISQHLHFEEKNK